MASLTAVRLSVMFSFCAGATARRWSRRSRAATATDGGLPSRLGPPLGGAETTGAGFGLDAAGAAGITRRPPQILLRLRHEPFRCQI